MVNVKDPRWLNENCCRCDKYSEDMAKSTCDIEKAITYAIMAKRDLSDEMMKRIGDAPICKEIDNQHDNVMKLMGKEFQTHREILKKLNGRYSQQHVIKILYQLVEEGKVVREEFVIERTRRTRTRTYAIGWKLTPRIAEQTTDPGSVEK